MHSSFRCYLFPTFKLIFQTLGTLCGSTMALVRGNTEWGTGLWFENRRPAELPYWSSFAPWRIPWLSDVFFEKLYWDPEHLDKIRVFETCANLLFHSPAVERQSVYLSGQLRVQNEKKHLEAHSCLMKDTNSVIACSWNFRVQKYKKKNSHYFM